MKSKVARQHNVTGIRYLSIGTTANDRGHILKRYGVNIPNKVSASFYFGKNVDQFTAYLSACTLLKEHGEKIGGKKKLTEIYFQYDHESLI